MKMEDALVEVWRQVMVEDAKMVRLDGASYAVRRTSRSKLREVDVKIANRMVRGVEQNSQTNSRWAQMARQGRKVMQFMEDRRYIAVVVDGKVTLYGHHDSGKTA